MDFDELSLGEGSELVDPVNGVLPFGESFDLVVPFASIVMGEQPVVL